jgi:hypothetical protein
MNDIQSIQNQSNKDQDNKKKIYFSNVFSKVAKSEKDKLYTKLQNNLNGLAKDVKLLEEYDNKDNLGKKKKFRYGRLGGHENAYKRFIRNSALFRKKMKNANQINLLGNIIYLNNNKSSNSKKKKSSKSKKTNRYTKKTQLIYKTEVKDYPKLINGNKLPKINLNSDRASESNIDTSFNNNLNNSSSTRLPVILNRDPNKLYLFTDGNEEKQNIVKFNKKNYRRYYVSHKNINSSENSFVQKFPTIMNSQRRNSSINRDELGQSADKVVKMMQEKNIKIKGRINYKLAEEELVDWEMKSKIKLAQWKFGIAEIEKYFVDLRAYGKPEEEELLKRKTFYDVVEDLIDDIKKVKEEKDIEKIKGKYNKEEKKDLDDFEKNEKGKKKDEDIDIVDNAMNKHAEVSDALKKIQKRKINEEKKRHLIDTILVQSDLRRRAINRSTEKLYENKEVIGEQLDHNKTIKYENLDNKNLMNKNNGILINNEKEEDEKDDE